VAHFFTISLGIGQDSFRQWLSLLAKQVTRATLVEEILGVHKLADNLKGM
jgi:hypothetical protein